jgi:hypothetical protein
MNIIGIIQKVNSTYSQVNPSLQILANEGIILDQRLGRIRLIKLNRDNPKTTLLLQALKILETQSPISGKAQNIITRKVLTKNLGSLTTDSDVVTPIFRDKGGQNQI